MSGGGTPGVRARSPSLRGGTEGADEEGEADLDGVVEAAGVEAGQQRDLVEPVAEGVAMDRECPCKRRIGGLFTAPGFDAAGRSD